MTKTALIHAVQRAARTEILPRFRALSPEQVSSKSNRHDLVTVAEQFAEDMISKAVRSILPGAFILGEEAAAEDPGLIDALDNANLAVIIDPIDGTWNYAHGLANFGSIMASMSELLPVSWTPG
ncbi:MAG: hypothetical protein KKB02_02235 [Alphaproteobacteria bacterium]|nr:hypothetical protein [Alphaproteobacteria bacterium]